MEEDPFPPLGKSSLNIHRTKSKTVYASSKDTNAVARFVLTPVKNYDIFLCEIINNKFG